MIDKLRKALRKDFKELYSKGYTIDYKTKRLLIDIEIGIMRLNNTMKLLEETK